MTSGDGREAPGTIAHTEILDTETIDAVIDSLLATDPPPYVFALGDTGLSVPVPDAVPIARDHTISGTGNALDLCVPDDVATVVDAWMRARAQRGAQATLRLRRDPEHRVTLHFVDARHRFGSYLGVFVGTRGAVADAALPRGMFRPRVCSFERDEVSVVRAVDDAFTKILGWTADEIVGTRTLDFTHPDDRALGIANWMEMLGHPGAEQRLLLRYRHRDGTYLWFETTNRNLLRERGRVVSELVDVSEKIEAVNALRASEELLRRLTAALPIGVLQIDAARRIVYRNERVGAILGGADATLLDDQFAGVVNAGRTALGAAVDAALGHAEDTDLEVTAGTAAGTKRLSVALRPLCAPTGAVTGAIVCVTDVTERERMHEELERRATYDNLTRCYNRASILEALDATLARHESNRGGIAVVFVDLNEFKAVNDRHGHAAGDELLRRTGERLMNGVRGCDLVGRLGGDEFLIVCPDVPSPEIAGQIGCRVAAALHVPTTLGAASIVPSSSIGVAWADRASDAHALVATADAAMYEAKRGSPSPVLRTHDERAPAHH